MLNKYTLLGIVSFLSINISAMDTSPNLNQKQHTVMQAIEHQYPLANRICSLGIRTVGYATYGLVVVKTGGLALRYAPEVCTAIETAATIKDIVTSNPVKQTNN